MKCRMRRSIQQEGRKETTSEMDWTPLFLFFSMINFVLKYVEVQPTICLFVKGKHGWKMLEIEAEKGWKRWMEEEPCLAVRKELLFVGYVGDSLVG